MKKLFLAMAFTGLATGSFAQDFEQNEDPAKKFSVATNSFWSNWFIQVGAEWNAFYSEEEHGNNLPTSPFEKFRSNPGIGIAVGKWFSPGLGLRTKIQGFWGKSVLAGSNGQALDISNKYWILNEHALLNVSNILYGYNPDRVWNFIPFAGAGFGRSMTHNFYAMHLSAGILNEFNVSKKLAINLELGWNRSESDIDGGYHYVGNRGWDSHDNNLYAEVGITYNLGKSGWEKTPDVDAIKALSQSQIDALNAQLDDANAENARLKKMLADQKPVETPKAVKEFVMTPVTVFFNLDKTNIASQKDLVNVQAVANYAKENNCNLIVNGYADSATGKADHNQWLSEKRAETVAGELVKMGISRDKISTKGNGGVDELSPISFNRRATVQIAND